jgi:hypothetical protein
MRLAGTLPNTDKPRDSDFTGKRSEWAEVPVTTADGWVQTT